MGRRLIYLVLVVAVVIGSQFFRKKPVDVELALELGPRAGEVKALGLVITDARDRVARDLRLSFPEGAPTEVRRHVPLAPGDYSVAARVGERQLTRSLRVVESGSYTLSLE
jgi:hypothetical protein